MGVFPHPKPGPHGLMMSQSRRQAGGGGAHEQVHRNLHGVGLTGRHLKWSPLSPWDSVKLGASFPEHCCTPDRLHLVTLAAAPATGLAHGQAPMSSHLEPHTQLGWGGGWGHGPVQKEKQKKSIQVFQTGRLTNLGTNLKKTLKKKPTSEKHKRED